MAQDERTHLFISYAIEDWQLADWLSLRLTAEGYEVWYDRIKLLGGESYPNDIDDALKRKTFRVLHLLSRHSRDKPNPVKERTAALNIGRERKIDFLIPLNVDGMGATELPWMAADLSFIPFFGDWAGGLSKLLKKLVSIDAPRPLTNGKEFVRDYYTDQDFIQPVPEPVWTNVLDILELPHTIYRVRALNAGRVQWQPEPIFFPHGDSFWTFELPEVPLELGVEEFSCDPEQIVDRLPLLNPITSLLRGHLIRHARQRGLRFTGRGSELYFPLGVPPNGHLGFQLPGERRTWVAAAGERTFVTQHHREKSRYHLAFELRPVLQVFERPVIEIQLAVWLTDLAGNRLNPVTAQRRRKRICHDWWNYEWLARTFGVASWLAGGMDSYVVLSGATGSLAISGRPFCLQSSVRIDESQLEGAPSVDETIEIEDSWVRLEDEADDGEIPNPE